jgi:transcriptional regulator with XRE-family HTH domain
MPTRKTTNTTARRRRHLGIVGPTETASVGQRLQEFRRTRGLLQDELARDLGLNQRIISRIETGARQMQPEELDLFKKVYDLELDSVRVPKSTAATPLALEDGEYLDAQQQLVMRGTGPYALWILNPESLPMLESNRFTHAWAENLATNGFDYHTVWILDLAQREDLRRFATRVQEVAKHASDSGWEEGRSGKVYVHPLLLPPPPPGDTPNRPVAETVQVQDFYEKLRQAFLEAPLDPNLLVFAKPHQLAVATNLELLVFLLRFYFEPACVIAYKPSRLIDKPLVAIGLKDVVRHDDPKPQRGFCFLGDASVNRFMSHIDQLERLTEQESL